MGMPLHLTEITLRLVLTVIAGILIGYTVARHRRRPMPWRRPARYRHHRDGARHLGAARTALGRKLASATDPARLSVTLAADGLSESALRDQLIAAGLSIVGHRVTVECAGGYRSLVFELRRCHRPDDTATPPVIAALASEAGVRKLHWDALR